MKLVGFRAHPSPLFEIWMLHIQTYNKDMQIRWQRKGSDTTTLIESNTIIHY